MKWIRVATATCVSVGIAVVGALPSNAATAAFSGSADSELSVTLEPSEEGALRLATPDEQRRADIADRRVMFPGITDAEADAYNSSYNSMLSLAYSLQSEFGKYYAYYEVANNKVFTATLHLKGAPASVLSLARKAGPTNLIIDNDVKYSSLERTQLTQAAHLPIASSGLVASVWTQYDYPSDSITVEINPTPGISLSKITASAAKTVTLPGVEVPLGGRTAIPVRYVEGRPEGLDAVMSGGTALGQSTGNNVPLWCTAAFGAQDLIQTTRKGLLTAEHCGTTLSYEASFMLSAKPQSNGSVLADARFIYNDAHSSRNVFIFAAGSNGSWLTRNVTSRGTVGVGGRVCNFGHTTAPYHTGSEKCTNVATLDGSWSGCNSTGCYNFTNQYTTTRDLNDGGDSGGPWYVNNAALGIHSASTSGGYDIPGGRSLFSSIFDAQRKTGTTVSIA